MYNFSPIPAWIYLFKIFCIKSAFNLNFVVYEHILYVLIHFVMKQWASITDKLLIPNIVSATGDISMQVSDLTRSQYYDYFKEKFMHYKFVYIFILFLKLLAHNQ